MAGADGGGASPVASFATTTIGVGNVDCGASAGGTQTFSISNTGNAPLDVTATVNGTVFSASPTSLTVAAGSSDTITITAVVPASATAGSTLTGSMALTTNDPNNASASIPLSAVATGATLAWGTSSPTSANFGVQKLNAAATPIGLTLVNSGNAAASVTFGAPSDSQFSLSPTSANIAASGQASLSAGFTPTTTTASTATSAFTVTGAVCGTSVSSLSFAGQGGTGDVTGWPTGTVDFGGGSCGGGAPAKQTFTLSNSGSIAAHLTKVTFGGYAGYTSSAAAGATIPAGGTLVVTLRAPAIPYPSAVPGNFGGSVTYTTDVAGDTSHQLTLTEHAVGAILAWDTSATPGFGNFGTVPAGTNANQALAIVNSGNADANVTLVTGTPFSVAPATFTVTGGASQSDTATFSPQTFGGATGSLSMSATGLCQALPSALSLTGTGQAGGISLSSQSLAFTVNCGETAAPQTLTLQNPGNAPFDWSAQLPNGTSSDSIYSFAPASGTIAAGGTATITVTPAAMAQYPANTDPSAFADQLTITTNIPNDTAHTVSLSETPLGDILSVKPTSLSFGNQPVSTKTAAQTFVVANAANTGSPTANVTIASSDASAFPVTPTSTTADPGSTSADVSVEFDAPAAPGSYSSDITLATNDVLCAPLPTGVKATGTATQAGPAYNPPAPLQFGLVNCGSTASLQQVTASNTGTQSYTITSLTLAKGASSYFTVAMSPASGVVDPGKTVTITVTPIGIPQTVPSVPDSGTYSDTLTIATNANVSSPDTSYDLEMGAQGVIISNKLASTSWSFGTVNFGSTGFFNNLIKNTGNESAVVTLTGMNYPNIFGLQGQPVDVAGGATTLSGTFTPPSGSGSWADQATLTVVPTAGAVLCQPLPSSWQTPTIDLTGKASNNPTISVSPTSLPFPAATCGSTLPASEQVQVQNNASTAQAYSAVLGSTGSATGTFYTITAGASGSIPATGLATLTITPTVDLTAGGGSATGSAPYNDNVIITVGGTQYYIPVTMTVNGVVIVLNNRLNSSAYGYSGSACTNISYDYYAQSYYYFGTLYSTNQYSPVVTNNGNVSGAVTTTFGGFGGSFFNSSPMSTSVPAGGQQSFTLADPGDPGQYCYGPFAGWYTATETFSAPNSCQGPVTVDIAGRYERF